MSSIPQPRFKYIVPIPFPPSLTPSFSPLAHPPNLNSSLSTIARNDKHENDANSTLRSGRADSRRIGQAPHTPYHPAVRGAGGLSIGTGSQRMANRRKHVPARRTAAEAVAQVGAAVRRAVPAPHGVWGLGVY